MSYRVFFSFSVGLKGPMLVPAGTLAALQEHVAYVEQVLGFKTEKYRDNPKHWRNTKPKKDVTDEVFNKVADSHNGWVRWLYHAFGKWQEATTEKPPRGAWYPRIHPGVGEDAQRFDDNNYGKPPGVPDTLTPEDAATFWHGLTEITVPAERWTREAYVDRMNHVYEVLRGNEHEGVTFDGKALSSKQAAAVIRVFSEYLDGHDCRLDVPNGYDYLASSYDGGYDWCEDCGPCHPDDRSSCRKKACPLLAEDDANDPDDARRWVVKDKAAKVYLGTAIDHWPGKLGKKVQHFDEREDAVAAAAKYTKRALVVVPVRRA